MKEAKEYLKENFLLDDIIFNKDNVGVWLSDFIEMVQKDTYNQAIDDAVDNAYATIEYDPNSYCGNTGSEYPPDEIAVVNKNSILKLKKQ